VILRQLGYLVALARERHFGRAAAACRVSQPTLLSGVKELETELGVLIVMRGQRYQGLTPEGQRVLEWAERILSDRDALIQELSEMRGNLHGRLRLSVVPTALPLIVRLTAPFCKKHPHVAVSATIESSVNIQRALDNFELDVGITYLENEPILRAKSFPLYRERYCLVVPVDGPFRGRGTVSWREAADLALCLLTPDMQNRRIVDAAFHSAGCQPKPQIETNSITNLALHVQTGQWSAVIPRHFLSTPGLPANVRALDLVEPTVQQLVGAVLSNRDPLPPTAKAMLAQITELIGSDMFHSKNK
jgi:DNA-binding transcriptional LysR family regulator